jgi:hypothetical protein
LSDGTSSGALRLAAEKKGDPVPTRMTKVNAETTDDD